MSHGFYDENDLTNFRSWHYYH